MTPVWNDSERLAVFGPKLAKALLQAELPVRWIVADDGSSSAEKVHLARLITELAQVYPRVEGLFLDVRSRKGGAVYQAWDECPDAAWLGFVDADGAIDPVSVIQMMRRLSEVGLDGGLVGVRRDTVDTPVKRPLLRRCSFRVFAFLVQRLVGGSVDDTQCGLKFVSGRAYRTLADRLEERGFAFDVELLFALERYGCRIQQMPIPWCEVSGSKVRPFRDAWSMFAALWRIRQRIRWGVYD